MRRPGARGGPRRDREIDEEAVARARRRVVEKITELIGQHPARAPALVRARAARDRDLGQVRVHEPGRLGQGPRRRQDDPDAVAAASWTPGKEIIDSTSGQHRHRLLADRRGAGLPGDAGDAGQRLVGAAQDQRGLRHQAGLLQPDGGLGRRHQPVPPAGRREPERYFYPNQYGNESNPRGHYEGTGREIWEQTGGRVTHFVAGIGTSGTVMGTSRRLKAYSRRGEVLRRRAGRGPARPRGAQAHGQLDRARHLPPRGAGRRAAHLHRGRPGTCASS